MSAAQSSGEQWDEIEFLSSPVRVRGGEQLFQVARPGPSGTAKQIDVYLTKTDASRIDRFCRSQGEVFRPTAGMGASVVLEPGTNGFGNAAFALKKVRLPMRESGFLSTWRRDQAAAAATQLECLRDEPRAFTDMSEAERVSLSEALQTKTVLVIAPKDSAGEQDLLHKLREAGVAPNRFRVRNATLQTDPDKVAAGIARAMSDAEGRDALVVVTRGGTGVPLAPFDSLEVAEVFHSSPVPVLCAVGHQRDVHLSDRASDWSAITPSDAGAAIAQLMCPRADDPVSAPRAVGSAPPRRSAHEGDGSDSEATRPLPQSPWAGSGPDVPFTASESPVVGGAARAAPFAKPSAAPASVRPARPKPTAAQRWRRRQRRRGMVRGAFVLGVLGMLVGFAWSILGPSLRGLGGGDEAASVTSAQTFVSPSGNIVCEVSSTVARCDIDEVHYGVPAVPARCAKTPNWGHVFVVGDAGAQYVCPGTRRTRASFPARTLAYGDTVTSGDVTCRSASTGVTCERDGHGFTVAKNSKRLW